WHGLSAFTREPEDCIRLLEGAGFATHVIQRAAGFVRLRAELAGEAVVIDLVAEPVPCIEPPDEVAAADTKIRIDSAYEILVNKLGTLLHRAELRDLVDLQALLDHGGDLGRALRDASRKDGGFSPVMVGYLLQGFPLERQAMVAGLDAAATAALDRFRVELISKIAKLSQP
ncbi:MAG: nucleotidyl transferase AbiEii/AbiGii toxin family protein, partial [Planctomycetota bacterium]|nr:nucleotidyl transferase AbiEii/AbiGii toxin family protein [Planctomycetota bacterium]